MGRGQGQHTHAMASRRANRYQQARRASVEQEQRMRARFPELLRNPPPISPPGTHPTQDELLFLAANLERAAERLADSARRREDKRARRQARRAAEQAAA